MDVRVASESHSQEVQQALQSYENARFGYLRNLRLALEETDSAKRAVLMQSVTQQNQNLINAAETIIRITGDSKNGTSAATVEDLKKQLVAYRKQLESINQNSGRVLQLQELMNQTKSSSTLAETYYFGYLIAILIFILLIILLFLVSSLNGGDGGDVGSALPSGPVPFSIPIKFDVQS